VIAFCADSALAFSQHIPQQIMPKEGATALQFT